MDCGSPSAWEELVRTASAVRATPLVNAGAQPLRSRLRRAIRPLATGAVLLTACGLAVLHLTGTAGIVSANSGQDLELFSLTNGDRTSNGVHSLVFSGTLENIGEGASYDCRGIKVHGRSDDMIQRNYFAHPILGCGEYVFSMMQAYGVHYSSAGENIGWEAGAGSPASYINSAFMASTDHRDNILDSPLHRDGRRLRRERPGRDLDRRVARAAERLDVQRGVRPGRAPPPHHRHGRHRRRSRQHATARGRQTATVAPATTAPLPSTPVPTVNPGGDPVGQPSPGPAGAADRSVRGLYPNTIESVLEAFLNF